MALKSAIYKTGPQIADTDRHYYINHALTVTRHPSENDERMMVRVLASAHHANETLASTRGLSRLDEPELWQCNSTGTVELWIDLGNSGDMCTRETSNHAEQVAAYTYSGNASRVWWQQTRAKVTRFASVSVCEIAAGTMVALAVMVECTIRLQVIIQGDDTWITNDADSVHIQFETLEAVAAARACSLITRATPRDSS